MRRVVHLTRRLGKETSCRRSPILALMACHRRYSVSQMPEQKNVPSLSPLRVPNVHGTAGYKEQSLRCITCIYNFAFTILYEAFQHVQVGTPKDQHAN